MKLLLQLAIRDLLRYRRRTLLTFLVLSFGVMIFLVYTAVLEGFNRSSFENMINFNTGHFKLRSSSWNPDDRFNTDHLIKAETVSNVMNRLQKLPFISGAAQRLHFIAGMDNSRDALPCIVTGIQPERDHTVFTMTNFIERGNFSTEGMVLGKKLAADLGLSTGDSAFITFRRESGMYDSVMLPVSGVIRAGDPVVNSSSVYITLQLAQKLLHTGGVSEIALRSDDMERVADYTAQLKSALSSLQHPLQLKNWREMSSGIAAISEAKNSVSFIFLIFLAVIALVGIINTVLLSVFEKKREIGTLKALGMTDRAVQQLFVIEAGIIGVLGSLTGIILGSLLVWVLSVHGIDMGALIGDSATDFGFRVLGEVKAVQQLAPVIQGFVFSVAAALLAGFLPARKTTRLQPAECLRTIQ